MVYFGDHSLKKSHIDWTNIITQHFVEGRKINIFDRKYTLNEHSKFKFLITELLKVEALFPKTPHKLWLVWTPKSAVFTDDGRFLRSRTVN